MLLLLSGRMREMLYGRGNFRKRESMLWASELAIAIRCQRLTNRTRLENS